MWLKVLKGGALGVAGTMLEDGTLQLFPYVLTLPLGWI